MAQVRIRRDGAVETLIGSQDIGTGSRTIAAIVTSVRLGFLPLDRITIRMGESDLPPSGASGGSATTGMMNEEIGAAAEAAGWILLAKCAETLEVGADTLEFREGGRIGVRDEDRELSWEEATALLEEDAVGLRTVPIEEGSLWYLADLGRVRSGGKYRSGG